VFGRAFPLFKYHLGNLRKGKHQPTKHQFLGLKFVGFPHGDLSDLKNWKKELILRTNIEDPGGPIATQTVLFQRITVITIQRPSKVTSKSPSTNIAMKKLAV